jgi:hypothetical protein
MQTKFGGSNEASTNWFNNKIHRTKQILFFEEVAE